MALKDNIYNLRSKAKLSQAEFAERFDVSHQSVQKWESGQSKPTLDTLIRMARSFHISVDAILFDSTARIEEEKTENRRIYPSYDSLPSSELYSEELECEYEQLVNEGVDIEDYKDLFKCVSKLKRSKYKMRIADIIFEIALNAPQREDYSYNEPSELQAIRTLRKPFTITTKDIRPGDLYSRIAGAWYGRICGCLLGKPVEGIKTTELLPLLKDSGNYPLHRYILRSDISADMIQNFNFALGGRDGYTDVISCAPVDDDTNYTVLYQLIIEK